MPTPTLTFTEYQTLGSRTASDTAWLIGSQFHALLAVLRLAEAVGQVADALKKAIGHGHPLTWEELDPLVAQIGLMLQEADRELGYFRTQADEHPATQREMLAVVALGIVGEAGEQAALLASHMVLGAHGTSEERIAALAKETGDQLWYQQRLASLLGLDLGTIAEANIAKLMARYPEGFSAADSLARRDETAQPYTLPPTQEWHGAGVAESDQEATGG